MKKKVNVFGKSVPVFAIAILSVALVSAALVPYISNVVIGMVTVKSPFTVEISANGINYVETPTNLSSVHGGENVSLWLKVINHLNENVDDVAIKAEISNDINNVSCEDFSNVLIYGNNSGSEPVWNAPLNSSVCSVVEGVAKVTFPAKYVAYETETYNITLTYALNVQPANYTITVGVNKTA